MDSTPAPHELFPFSYWDEVRGRWIRARYVAELATIKERYSRYRIEGPPEIRGGKCQQFIPPGDGLHHK